MAKIAIRADGGLQIGMGHIMRTLVLAKELAKTNDVFYICRIDDPITEKYKSGINMVKSEGFTVKLINEKQCIEDLKKINADCLITDSYDVDENYFNDTKKIFNKTGYIDDMNLFYFNVDFLINQNINAEEFRYSANNETRFFLGPKYVMLREEFRNAPQKEIKENISNVLITVGGSNINNITEKLLNCVKELKYNFHVVIGPSFGDISDLFYIAQKNKNIQLYLDANMFELMQKCDMAISGCGSTLYELIACGVPTIGIVLADNQLKIAKYMDENNMIINMGLIGNLEMESFNHKISLLNDLNKRNKLSNNSIMVSKYGVMTLTKNINDILREESNA